MTRHQRFRPHSSGPPLGLALVLAVLTASPVRAQPLSSGSGVGTGTGMMGGAARNSTGTGLEAGSGFGTGMEAGTGRPLPGREQLLWSQRATRTSAQPPQSLSGGRRFRRSRRRRHVPRRRRHVSPTTSMLESSLVEKGAGMSIISEKHLEYARRIPNPSDRSLTLSRIASAATFSAQLDVAEKALDDASAAGLLITPGLVQDQRLMAIISSVMNLAEAPCAKDAETSLPAVARPDRDEKARRDRADDPRADGSQHDDPPFRGRLAARAALAKKIGNPTYRAELMYKVADGMAYASQTIVNEFPGAGERQRRRCPYGEFVVRRTARQTPPTSRRPRGGD